MARLDEFDGLLLGRIGLRGDLEAGAFYLMSGKRGKNAAADAAATSEAVQRPTMRFVPIKIEEQQSRLMVHRARQGFVGERTACINRICGLMSEFGVMLPLKAEVVRRAARHHLEDLPDYANTDIGDLLSEVSHLDERVKKYSGRPTGARLGAVTGQPWGTGLGRGGVRAD